MIEQIMHDGELLAIVIRSDFQKDGIEFFTESDSPMQLGYMQRQKGYEISPHVHRRVRRVVDELNEVLWIKRGRVRVDFYTSRKEYVRSGELAQNDVVLLIGGGHGFTMLEDTEIIEAKQGPYVGDRDKERFDRPKSAGD